VEVSEMKRKRKEKWKRKEWSHFFWVLPLFFWGGWRNKTKSPAALFALIIITSSHSSVHRVISLQNSLLTPYKMKKAPFRHQGSQANKCSVVNMFMIVWIFIMGLAGM
jgi:hypothetical protein